MSTRASGSATSPLPGWKRSVSSDTRSGSGGTRRPGGAARGRRRPDKLERVSSSACPANEDGAEHGRWHIPATARELAGLRRELERLLAASDTDADTTAAIVLAVNEAVANAIEHGARGNAAEHVVVEATLDGDGLARFVVTDRGTWRPPPVVTNRGRGIDLMRAVMDDVRIDAAANGTIVHLARRLTPSPDPTESGTTSTADADIVVLTLPHDVDHANALELSARIRNETSDVPKLILDFSETGFFDSAAVALVVRVVQHRRAGDLPTVAVAPSNRPVRAVLRISGLEELVDICDTVPAAKMRFS